MPKNKSNSDIVDDVQPVEDNSWIPLNPLDLKDETKRTEENLNIRVFDETHLSDLFKSIYENHRVKNTKLQEIVEIMQDKIDKCDDSDKIIELLNGLNNTIRTWLGNDDNMIRMSAVVQRIQSQINTFEKNNKNNASSSSRKSSTKESDDVEITDEEYDKVIALAKEAARLV